MAGAVAKVQVDQGLVRDSASLRDALKVLDSRRVEPDRNLLLQPFCVRIAACLGKIVFFPHRFNLCQYWACSTRVLLRTLMIRIVSPLSRRQWLTTRTRALKLRPIRRKRSSMSE